MKGQMDSESEHWTEMDGETKCIAVFKRRNAVLKRRALVRAMFLRCLDNQPRPGHLLSLLSWHKPEYISGVNLCLHDFTSDTEKAVSSPLRSDTQSNYLALQVVLVNIRMWKAFIDRSLKQFLGSTASYWNCWGMPLSRWDEVLTYNYSPLVHDMLRSGLDSWGNIPQSPAGAAEMLSLSKISPSTDLFLLPLTDGQENV